MKIAIIAHSHYPIEQPFVGGLEAHTYYLAQQLQQIGHEVTLFSAAGSDQRLPFVPFFKPTAASLYSSTINVRSYRERRYSSLMRLLRNGNYDLVHNNSLHYMPLRLVASLPVPMVTVLHTPPFKSLAEGFKSSLAATNHRVIAISKSVTKSWHKVVPGLKTCLIYNGVDTQHWQPIDQQQNYAIWSGRITPEKGVHWAIAAAQQANVPLKICGPVHDNEYFSQKVEPLLNERITYLGNLSTTTLARYVAQAQVFLCTPCWDEPFGLVTAEALASGTPVVGFARGALAEVVTSDTGILVPHSVEALARAIQQAQFLSREACRQRAIAQFSMTMMIQRYDQLYRTLVAERSPSQPTLPLVS